MDPILLIFIYFYFHLLENLQDLCRPQFLQDT